MFKITAGVGAPVQETLEGIIKYSERLRLKAESYRAPLRNIYPELDAFNTITNNMFMVSELTKYYLASWSKKRQKLLTADCEQINRLLTMMYIHCFMVTEYHTKELVKRSYSEVFEKEKMSIIMGKNVYMDTIISKSRGNLVTENQQHVWDVLRKIRNAAVHNNAFFIHSDKATYELGNRSVTIEYKSGDFLRGDLDFPLTLIEILMELFYDWVSKLLKLG